MLYFAILLQKAPKVLGVSPPILHQTSYENSGGKEYGGKEVRITIFIIKKMGWECGEYMGELSFRWLTSFADLRT